MFFRGTNEWEDWLDNVNAIPTSRLFGSFHRGFYQSVMDLWSGIEKSVTSMRREKKRPIFFTGHSLGGALATIGAAIYLYEDRPFTSVYTLDNLVVWTVKPPDFLNFTGGMIAFSFSE